MSLRTVKYLKSLLIKSAVVQMEIEHEQKKKFPNWLRIIMLKKQRLLIKDKLLQLRRVYRENKAKRKREATLKRVHFCMN